MTIEEGGALARVLLLAAGQSTGLVYAGCGDWAARHKARIADGKLLAALLGREFPDGGSAAFEAKPLATKWTKPEEVRRSGRDAG